MSDGLREFLAMGGYGFYVWLSYGLSAVVLLGNLLLAARRERRVLGALAARLAGGTTDDPA